MGTSALRFEPVSCVVTVVVDGTEDVRVFELTAPGTQIARTGPFGSEHFSDVYGALVYVGSALRTRERGVAAAIIDLPDGRTIVRGTALIQHCRGRLEVSISARSDAGEVLRMQLNCPKPDSASRELAPSA